MRAWQHASRDFHARGCYSKATFKFASEPKGKALIALDRRAALFQVAALTHSSAHAVLDQ